jgi:hypothetical protein
MSNNELLITPPPELVQRLRSEAPHGIRDAGVTRELHLITAAFRAGADQELEKCCDWLEGYEKDGWAAERMRIDLRPKPPSQAEQALDALKDLDQRYPASHQAVIVRAALERLRELERTAGN